MTGVGWQCGRLNAGGLLFALLLFSGCTNNPHPKAYQEKEPDGSPWVVTYRAIGDDPRSLDPQFTYDTISNAIVAQVYECLLEYDPFKNDPYVLEPCLAAAMPERTVNPDGTETYLIKIKPGLHFSDDPCFTATAGRGREMVAEDFCYSFKRMADPAVECPVLSNLQDHLPGMKAAYDDARKAGHFDYSKPLPAIQALDAYTLKLTLSDAYPQIKFWLAMPFTAPVPHEAIEYYDGREHDGRMRELFKFHPVGVAPFRMAEWSRSRLIRLVRNENYTATAFPAGGWAPEEEAAFRPLAGHPLPLVDEAQFMIIREPIPAWLLFREGYLDRSAIGKDVFSTVVTSSHELAPKFKALGMQLFKDVELGTFYSIFNMDDPVVGKNKKLRQAISEAYDEDRENELFFNGVQMKAEQLLPPGVFGFQKDYKDPYRTQDLGRAKALLAEAGYPEGRDPKTGEPLEITLDLVADSPTARQIAEFEQGQIEQLGIRVKLEQDTWARLQDKMDRGAYQMAGGSGWNADYPDPENFFFLFHSKNFPPEGSNHSRYHNPAYDRICEQMSGMDDTPERLELIKKLNSILNEDCPYIPDFHSVLFGLGQGWAPRTTSNAMLLLGAGAKYMVAEPKPRDAKIAEWNKPDYRPLWVFAFGLAAAGVYGVQWARRRNV